MLCIYMLVFETKTLYKSIKRRYLHKKVNKSISSHPEKTD